MAASSERPLELYRVAALVDAALSGDGACADSPTLLGRAVRYIDVYERYAYVATNDGFLYWYTCSDENGAPSWQLEGSANVSVSGKPVEKVFVLGTLGLIAVLCEYTLRFLSFPSLGPVANKRLAPIKGVVQVVLDEAEEGDVGFVNMCLIRRQSLQVLLVDRDAWAVVKVSRVLAAS